MPSTPIGDGVSFGMTQFMEALRHNVDVLMDDAVLRSGVTVAQLKSPEVTSLTYEGAGLAITDVGNVPVFEDVAKLAQDVQKLASDVNYILQYLDVLARQLK